MYLIGIMAKSLKAYDIVCRFSYYVWRNRMSFVCSMLCNIHLYGPSHIRVDTPSVTLLEHLNPKLLFWSLLFPFSWIPLRAFQRSRYVFFPRLMCSVTVLCFCRLYTCCLSSFLMEGDCWFCVVVSGVPREGGLWCSSPPPKFWRPSKIVKKAQTDCENCF